MGTSDEKIQKSQILWDGLMIFVTVGMHSQGFERLIKKMDEIAGKITEEVIMQIGSTIYQPKNAHFFDFVSDFEQFDQLLRDARVVVCHGGAGTILTALLQGTPVIAVPRLKQYHEHVDDHQLEIINEFAKKNFITKVEDVNDLELFLNDYKRTGMTLKGERENLISALKIYINNLEKEKN